MRGGIINFSTIPYVEFAHHFYTEKALNTTYATEKSIDIIYIKSGSLECQVYDDSFKAEEGSFLILPRHLPITRSKPEGEPCSYCKMKLVTEYDFEMFEETSGYLSTMSGIAIPFLTPPCQETENVKKDFFSAVSDFGISREKNGFSVALAAVSVLQKLSRIYSKKIRENRSPHSILEYKTKKYIAANLNRDLTISKIAKSMDKTPNYLNCVFKKQSGISIRQYINEEKVRLLCEMIQQRGISFKVAAENVGITDISYAYRLFKKHTGTTPTEYLLGERKTN